MVSEASLEPDGVGRPSRSEGRVTMSIILILLPLRGSRQAALAAVIAVLATLATHDSRSLAWTPTLRSGVPACGRDRVAQNPIDKGEP